MLRATTVPVASLRADTIAAAWALFEQAYAGADRERFERDLAEKQLVILLAERATGELKGFSTVLVRDGVGPRRATVVFSGDTVIDRAHWGEKQLQLAFARLLVS